MSPVPENKDAREGWSAQGADEAGIRRKMGETFSGGALPYLGSIIDRCEQWLFYPVYMLAPGGAWAKGRALLLGDAAHAVSWHRPIHILPNPFPICQATSARLVLPHELLYSILFSH